MLKTISGSADEWAVGNPDVLKEAREALSEAERSGSTAQINTPSAIDARKVLVKRETLGGDLNGDGYYDIVDGRAYRIGYGTEEEPYRWLTFTSVYLGSDEDTHNGETGRTTVISLAGADAVGARDSLSTPDSDFWSRSARLYIGEAQENLDQQVASAVEDIFTFCYNSIGYFELVEATQTHRDIEAATHKEKLITNLRDEFVFALPGLRRWIEKNPGDKHVRRYRSVVREMTQRNPLRKEDRDILTQRLATARARSEEAQGLKKELHCDVQCSEPCERFPPVPPSYFLRFTAADANPLKAANYLSGQTFKLRYEGAEGGIFDGSESGFIATANRMARAAGFKNYAELRLWELHGLPLDSVRFQMGLRIVGGIGRMRKIVADLRRFSEEERGVSDNPFIWENSISALLRARRSRRFGGKEPKLPLKDAIAAVKRFFKDMGFDLDSLPYGGEVIWDVYHRKDKHPEYEVPIGDGRTGWITADFREGNELEMWQLAKLVHETFHFVHFPPLP